MLRHDKLSHAADIPVLSVCSRTRIIFRTVDKANNIGILLDGTRLTKVAQLRTLVAVVAFLHLTAQLRQCDYRDVKLFGQLLEAS